MIRFAIFLSMLFGATRPVFSQTNYQYDERGRLIANYSEGIKKISWNNQNKIIELVHADTSHQPDVQFAYDVAGNRLMKLTKPRDGSRLLPENTWVYTYYTYDPHGNLVATYERKYEQKGAESYEELFTNVNQTIGGDAHLGYVNPESTSVTKSFNADLSAGRFSNVQQRGNLVAAVTTQHAVETYRGNTHYELNNYQQSVTAVVSDRKNYPASPDTALRSSEMIFAADYYPYGMTMPLREYNSYPYGFNGIERLHNHDDYAAHFRVLDTRIGRWTSPDPKAATYAEWSPYAAMADNPVRYGDPLGDEPLELSLMERLRAITHKFPKAYGMFRIILDLNSKFSTVDDNGDWKPKVPMHSTPRIPEETEKSQKKRNKVVNNNKGRTQLGGPPPPDEIAGELSPESGVREKAPGVANDVEAAPLQKGATRMVKNGLKIIPLVGIGMEVATAPEGQHPLQTGARILIGEAPVIGDLLLMSADYLYEDYEAPVPPKITLVNLNPQIPVGLTPEQYHNIRQALQLESAVPDEVVWKFPTDQSLSPKLQRAVDEMLRNSP